MVGGTMRKIGKRIDFRIRDEDRARAQELVQDLAKYTGGTATTASGYRAAIHLGLVLLEKILTGDDTTGAAQWLPLETPDA